MTKGQQGWQKDDIQQHESVVGMMGPSKGQ
jgi:hypothetical protein